ncbi:hypothetical protein Tco_0594913 [Tanacetum coccineum]
MSSPYFILKRVAVNDNPIVKPVEIREFLRVIIPGSSVLVSIHIELSLDGKLCLDDQDHVSISVVHINLSLMDHLRNAVFTSFDKLEKDLCAAYATKIPDSLQAEQLGANDSSKSIPLLSISFATTALKEKHFVVLVLGQVSFNSDAFCRWGTRPEVY